MAANDTQDLAENTPKVQTLIIPEESFENLNKLLALTKAADLPELVREAIAAYAELCNKRSQGIEIFEWNPNTRLIGRVMFSFDARIGTKPSQMPPMPRT